MARDRTARKRIRDHLAQRGAVSDAHGLATKVLKDAVDYQGSSVAFIQLIAAMERDGELEREIRGKRTYRIAAPAPIASGTPRPEPGAGADDAAPGGLATVDYDALARSLLRELTGGGVTAMLDHEIRAENRRIAAERDDYARRLDLARAKLDELRGSARDSRAER